MRKSKGERYMKKRIVAFLLSAAMVFTNIMPAMADTTVISLEGMVTEQSQEGKLQPDQDAVSDNDLSTDPAVDQQAEDMSDYSLNIPKNGTVSSGSSYGYAENRLNMIHVLQECQVSAISIWDHAGRIRHLLQQNPI